MVSWYSCVILYENKLLILSAIFSFTSPHGGDGGGRGEKERLSNIPQSCIHCHHKLNKSRQYQLLYRPIEFILCLSLCVL